MVGAEDAALEMRPESFNGIGADAVLGILAHAVTDNPVDIALAGETAVGGQFIGEHLRIVSNELLDDGHQGLRLGVLHLHGTDTTLTFNHTEDGGLGLGGTSLGSFNPLGFVLVGLTTTKVHFIHFHLTVQGGGVVLTVKGADLMEDEPGGLLGDMNVTAELARGNALLVAADEIHRNEPLAKANLRVLKDGSDGHGEVLTALVATVTTVLALYAVMTATVGANNVTLLPTGVTDGTLATVLGGKELGEFKYGIESAEVNHKAQV